MLIRNVRKHGTTNFNLSYSGEIEGSKVIVVFENGVYPTEGDIDVTVGKMITKKGQNFFYVKEYMEEFR